MKSPIPGSVAYLGAGCGNPAWLAVRAEQLLREADVVVFDGAVDPSLALRTPPGSERIAVGPLEGRAALPAHEVREILLRRARGGRRVVRLVAGDPLLDEPFAAEAAQLALDGVAVEVVPGVTALQAAVAAGVRLQDDTGRLPYAVVNGASDDVAWDSLARARVALAVLDPLPRWRTMADALLGAGLPSTTPVALVSRAGTADQRVEYVQLGQAGAAPDLPQPVLALLGPHTRARHQLRWAERRPLHGRRIALTRPAGSGAGHAAALAEAGASVTDLPLIEILEEIDRATADDVFAEFGGYEWAVFTSANGVRHFFAEFFRRFKDLRALGFTRLAVVGEATAEALRALRLEPEVVATPANAAALVAALAEAQTLDNVRILSVTGTLGGEDLVAGLEGHRAIVDRFIVYRTRPADIPAAVAEAWRRNGADAVLLASPSAAAVYAAASVGALALQPEARTPLLVAIGATTAEAMHKLGLRVAATCATPAPDSLVAALRDILPETRA